jgi:30S ribosomal protein S31
MGKGDKKSRRGKIWRGTFGKRRPRASNARPAAKTAPKK